MAQNELYRPKIAMIIDENSMLHIAGGSSLLGRDFIYASRTAFARSGTSFGQFTLDDDIQNNLESELKIYLSAWALSDAKREALKGHRKSGSTRVWFYAPGYINEDGNDLDAMKDLTGFEFHKTTCSSTLAIPTEEGNEFGLYSSWGYESELSPLFTINPDSCIVLAKYSNRHAAVAIKESAKGKDVFIGVPMLTDEIIKALVKIAGIETITDNEVLLWNSLNYTVLHCVNDGDINLTFDSSTQSIEDGVTGESLISGNELTLNLKMGETRILKHGQNISENIELEFLADKFELLPNYPNPFNPKTKIEYIIHGQSHVQISIYDVLGKKIDTIVDHLHETGKYRTSWNGSGFGSGIYILKMKTDNFTSSRKMLMIK